MPKQKRSDILYRVASILESRLDEFAHAESQDQGHLSSCQMLSHTHLMCPGKPFWLARSVDIPRAIYNFRFFAGSVLHTVDKCVNPLTFIFLQSINHQFHHTNQFNNYPVRFKMHA